MNDIGEETHLSLAYRVFLGQWFSDEQFEYTRRFLVENLEQTDSIWLFDSEFPAVPYAEKEEMETIYSTLKRRIEVLHSDGFRDVGIDVAHTLGHGTPKKLGRGIPFQRIVGFDGDMAETCACPNSPEFREYIKHKYQLAARVNPDFIWVDDDFRMSGNSVRFSCFCPLCIAGFGFDGEREALVSALNKPGNGKMRIRWDEYVIASLESLAADIEGAVHGINPGINIGLMLIGYSIATYGRDSFKYLKALKADRARPGHGFYTDERPLAILNKAIDVGRLALDFPPEVKTIQYELENWPYVNLDKSVATVLNESLLALMEGCTGTAYTFLRLDEGSLEGYDRYAKAITRERRLWERVVKLAHGMQYAGLWPAACSKMMPYKTVDGKGWFSGDEQYNFHKPNHLMTIGVPFSPSPDAACGVLLSGRAAEAFTVEELRQMLSEAVYMDNAALQVLWEKGLGELTGVKPVEPLSVSYCEKFTDHELNGAYKNDGRHLGFMSKQEACTLVPVKDGVGVLSHLEHSGKENKKCCFTVYENELGGRIAVSSFEAWERLGTFPKRNQLLNVLDWITRGMLPIFIEETVKVAPFIRRSADGKKVLLVLFNTAFDKVENIKIRLSSGHDRVWLLSAEGKKELKSVRQGAETVLEVPVIGAWSTIVLYGEED